MTETQLERHPENAPGPWFVSDECITCGMCDENAPTIFKVAEDYEQNVVHHQPEGEDEEALAQEMADECPVEAILKEG